MLAVMAELRFIPHCCESGLFVGLHCPPFRLPVAPAMAFTASLSTFAAVLGTAVTPAPAEHGVPEVKNITTDTRATASGDLFVALRGSQFDGHQFVAAAAAKGAIAAVVDHPIAGVSLPQLVVSDTLAAYQTLGRWWRRRSGAAIVAITGSVGKTTTKELIAAALGTQGAVLKTEANFNNEIGVPKTLLQLQPRHRYGVIEMGMRGRGQIALLGSIAQPNVAVITNVGTAHIGILGSEQAIAEAKCELLGSLGSEGVAVLNQDNPRLMDTAARIWSGRTLTYGLTGGDVHGHLDGEQVVVAGERLPLPLPGAHNALNFLAAVAVMQALDLDWRTLGQGLAVTMPGGRSRRLSGGSDVVVLDETYNAGVESMTAALHLLAAEPGNRRIAVLGTMYELGDHAAALHQRVGQVVHQLGIDELWTLAEPDAAEALAMGAAQTPTTTFATAVELVAHLQAAVQPGDRLLFKGSRAVGLDRVIAQWLEAKPPTGS